MNFLPEMKYLVISNENNCIYTYTPRLHTAMAIAEGNVDAFVHGVTYANMGKIEDYDRIINRDLFYEKIWSIDIGRTMILSVMDPDDISDGWKYTRELIRIRQEGFFHWETLVNNAYARVSHHIWEHFDVFADHELSKCDPENDKYEWTIEEYARIMSLSTQEAYKELKLQLESDKMKKFRIETFAMKWKEEINRVTNRDQLQIVRQQMSRDFWQNAMI